MAYKRYVGEGDDPDSIYDDVVEKKALPELILKANILQAQDNMLITERKMMMNYRLYKKFDRGSVAEYEGALILLFGFIKNMIADKGYKDDEAFFDDLCRLERGSRFKIMRLLALRDFLLKYLHVINITNLFQTKGKGWLEEVKDEY